MCTGKYCSSPHGDTTHVYQWPDWIEQCCTSPPTQYRLYGRRFYRSKDPTNSIKVLKENLQRKNQTTQTTNTHICICVFVVWIIDKTRKPSYRWQTRATRKPAKIAPIRRAYNVVADNTGLSSCVWLLLRPKSAKSREIHWKFKLMEFKVIQGHRSWCQSKAHMWLAISH